jgi:hypothetical protein
MGVSNSKDGLATAETAVAWLGHFDKHTKPRVAEAYRMLILESHEFHNSIKFQRLCEEKRIVTLCVPYRHSDQLHPFSAGYFPLVEREFKERSPRLALDPAWSLYLLFVAFDIASTEQNIRGSFRDAGLMPYNPDAARSIETSMSAYPARARRSPEPGNASLREFKVFAGQARWVR